MNPQATAQVQGSGSGGEIGVPPVLPRLVLRQSLSLHDHRQRPESLTALAVSHTLNPGPVPTFMLRHTDGSLVAVPATLTDRSSGRALNKVPDLSWHSAISMTQCRAAQLWR